MTAICNYPPRQSLFSRVTHRVAAVFSTGSRPRDDHDAALSLADVPAWLRNDLGLDGGVRLDERTPDSRSLIPGQALRDQQALRHHF